ncbi:MAG: hypothetical protein JNK87_03250 [Bryobacterales bacterium]|nr:hypothetical protein [Bryobacterales bacterium]
MDCIANCLVELRSRREQLDEAILALERLGTGAGARKRRRRPPEWLRAVQAQSQAQDTDAEARPRAGKAAPPRKEKKRRMSVEGKLAIQVGVALRQWKAGNPGASEEDLAKQRDRFRQQLQRKAS